MKNFIASSILPLVNISTNNEKQENDVSNTSENVVNQVNYSNKLYKAINFKLKEAVNSSTKRAETADWTCFCIAGHFREEVETLIVFL